MSDQSGEHVHHYDDGRGRRIVSVDGIRVRCIYADTKNDVAVVYDDPPKTTDGETLDFHPVWGDVQVTLIDGAIACP